MTTIVSVETAISEASCWLPEPFRRLPPWIQIRTGRRRFQNAWKLAGRYRLRYRQSSAVDPGPFVLGSCAHAFGSVFASRMPLQRGTRAGARQRRSSIGGAAYGTPRNCSAPLAVVPRTRPDSVQATGSPTLQPAIHPASKIEATPQIAAVQSGLARRRVGPDPASRARLYPSEREKALRRCPLWIRAESDRRWFDGVSALPRPLSAHILRSSFFGPSRCNVPSPRLATH